MTSAGAPAAGGAYEGMGRQSAMAVRGYSSIVVVSDDPVAAAHVAIGIALAETARRLVMITDLVGDIAPLQALIADDDPHGVYDSFTFGTSWRRIARAVSGASNLFAVPSGTESPATEDILASKRWTHLASEFAAADELLLLVVAAAAPGIDRLVAQVDGVVLVGIPGFDAAPDANILARLQHPASIPPPRIALMSRRRDSVSAAKLGIAAATLLAIGIAGGALFGLRLAASRSGSPRPVQAVAPAQTVATGSPLSAIAAGILPVNPQDSLGASAFSVEILAANTAEGANFELDRHRSAMPAATISLVPIGDTAATWYKVYAGAFTDSTEAEQLLASLRRRRILQDSAGSVVRAPYALLVDSLTPQAGLAAATRERVRGYVDRGMPVYALLQRDGSARIYAGAFERPEQTSLAATALRVAGVIPVLAYRTGRTP